MRQALVATLVVVVLGLVGWRGWRARQPRQAVAPAAPAAKSAGKRERAPARAPQPAGWPIVLAHAESAADDTLALGELTGRVRAATTGAVVPGAQLAFDYVGPGAPVRLSTTVSADADGRFRLQPAAAGRWELTAASAPGFRAFQAQPGQSPIAAELRPGVRVRDVELYLTPAVEYLGRVEDERGQPVAGAEVRRIDAAPLDGNPRSFRSDAQGQFRFFAPDGAQLEARKPGYRPARAELDLGASLSHRLTLRLEPGTAREPASLAGVVRDASGQPVEGARVWAWSREPGAVHPSAEALTASDGRFRFDGLDPGPHHVEASAPGHAPTQADADAPAEGLALTVGSGGRLRGHVRDAAGAPLTAFSVQAVPKRGALERGTATARSFLDGQGSYELDDLSPGAYVARAFAAGHAPSAEHTVEITAGAAAELDFALAQGARIVGRVIDRQRRTPIAQARVRLESAASDDDDGLAQSAPGALTDAEGRFVLEGVPPGLHSVLVSAAGHHARILSGLTVPPEGDAAPITVDLQPTKPDEDPRIELVGIGAVITPVGDALTIARLLPGGGGAAAGLQPGDVILAVDGTPVTELGFQDAIQRIRGPEDSVVALRVRRGDAPPIDVPVTRKRIGT